MAAAEIRQDIMANPWTYGAMAAECLPLGIGTTVSVAHAGYDVSTGTRTLARAGRDLAIDAAIGYVGGKTVAGLAKGGAFVAARVSAKVASRAAAKTALKATGNIPFPKKAAKAAGEADISVAKVLGPKPKVARGVTPRAGEKAEDVYAAKGFYSPQRMAQHLESKYPGSVTSSTLPQAGQKNVKLAGQRHPETGIVFDQRGLSIFDDVAKFDTRIAREVAHIKNETLHMRAATRSLRDEIKLGRIDKNRFTAKQLEDIYAGRDRINGLTWHHHQEFGRMQLIPREVHQKTGHVGGMEMWTFVGKK